MRVPEIQNGNVSEHGTSHIPAKELWLAQEPISMKNAWPGSLGASSPSNQCFGEGCYFGIAEYVGFLENANIVVQSVQHHNLSIQQMFRVAVIPPGLRRKHHLLRAPQSAFAKVRTVQHQVMLSTFLPRSCVFIGRRYVMPSIY